MNSHRLLAGVCAALLPLAASAVPVTYEFSGLLDQAGGLDLPDGQVFVPIVPIGSEFRGSFTIENETPISVEEPGLLRYFGAITGATISFGPGGTLGAFSSVATPNPLTSQSSSVLFINDNEFNGNPPYDQLTLQTSMETMPGAAANVHGGLSFSASDNSAQMLPTGLTLLDSLPVDALTATNFYQLAFGFITYDDTGNLIASSYVSSQQFMLAQVRASVPEPGTLALWGAGLAGLLLATRRRVRLETKRAAS